MEWTGFLLAALVLWQLAFWWMNNPVLMPSPFMVLQEMILQIQSGTFWNHLLQTSLRALSAGLLAYLAALISALASVLSHQAAWFFEKLSLLLQSIPNVAYIILLLFWMERSHAVVMVCFLMVYGVAFESFYKVLKQEHAKHADVFHLYPQPWYIRLEKAYLPEMEPVLASTFAISISMAFKACIMAEILASISTGIGYAIQKDRLLLNPAGLFGWVIWLVLLAGLFRKAGQWILKGLYSCMLSSGKPPFSKPDAHQD